MFARRASEKLNLAVLCNKGTASAGPLRQILKTWASAPASLFPAQGSDTTNVRTACL